MEMDEIRSRLMRAVVIAGLAGGLLGGLASFAASRLIKPVVAVPQAAETSEAREVAGIFIQKLEEGKFEEFTRDVGSAAGATEEKFQAFKSRFYQERVLYEKLHGPSTRQFEFVRESVASPSLVRVVYLEKYQTGGVLWFFVLYRTRDGWKIASVDWNDNISVVFTGIS